MNANSFEAQNVVYQDQETVREKSDDRHGLMGFIALLSLAIPALLIRNLFPDMNPLMLAGLGVTVYVAYLGLMIAVLLRQAEHEQTRPEAVPATTNRE